ncbi:MAG: hypothetical protein Q7S40_33115 [Opitutaceae bacterium]|nr:hypothetical protein [Opitutaceae bacterium]
MLIASRLAAAATACGGLLAAMAFAGSEPQLPLALRAVNPDMLSGAAFTRLYFRGAFGGGGTPPRSQAAYPDISKGRPPAVLDARVGANLRLLDDPDSLPATQRGQAEPHLYRSATNPDLLLATFQEGRFTDADGGAFNNGYAVSRDGGLTWTRALVPSLTPVTGGSYFRATDPVAAIGPQGDFYLNGLAALDPSFDTSALVLQRSTDQGVSWTPPTVIFQSPNATVFADKNWFVVNDLPGTVNPGRLVATWTNFTSTANGVATGNNIIASVSDDRGLTWSPSAEVTPFGSRNQGSLPFFLPDGSVGVVYINFLNTSNVTQFSISYKRSLDGGLTFPTTPTTFAGFVPGWDDPELRDAIFLPSATAARQTGDIFVTYTAVLGGSPRIMFMKSSDLGLTWTAPMAVSDQPAGMSVVNPAVATSADGRTVVIVFMDKRHAPDGRGFVDHSAAWSFDGGATWQSNVRLSEMSSDLRFGPQTPRGVMLGDYLAVAASFTADQPWAAIWCETRTGDSDPFVVRFAPAPVASFETWRVARFGRAELGNAELSGAAADFDGDGVSNVVEFDQGTNPRVPEYGETLVLRREQPDALDVATLGRPDGAGTVFAAGEVPPTPAEPAVPQPVPPIMFPQTLGIAAAPAVSARPGLVWRTTRFSGVAGKAMSVTREALHVVSQPAPPPGTSAMNLVTRGSTPESATNATNARLINVATRGRVGAGLSQMIVGFVLSGNKSMLVRAAGPALAAFGVPDPLPDPQLTLLVPGSDPIATNDNWPLGGATAALFNRLGAFPFNAASLDAALLLPLEAQSFTAVVAGATTSGTGATGIALVEAYDADAAPGAPANPRLLNLSTRGDVGVGENALVAGFVLTGSQPRRILVRAVGPSLSAFGVSGPLGDPLLSLFRGDERIASNDDWEISRSGAAVAATAQQVGAFALAPASLDAALLITLAPGSYTAVVTGLGGTTGIALVEVYDAD